MGKISGLPDEKRLAIIGYLAQEGVIKTITAEVPLRKTAEFREKYGVNPYPIYSDNKQGVQYRIYLTDPDSAPPLLKNALDLERGRLNDSAFVKELVDNYGFSFFAKQNSQLIQERAKHLPQDEYDTFLSGFKTNNDFIESLLSAVQSDSLPTPNIIPISDIEVTPGKKKGKKRSIPDSNAQFTDDQLMHLGWAGEEYLYKQLETGTEAAFAPFSIDVRNVDDVVWYNEGYSAKENWEDQSVGKGCDILVKTRASDCLIEVKSSRRRSPIFGMTSCEMQKMQELRNGYFLAKIDYLENLIIGQAPCLKVYRDPYARFFNPLKMQKAIFYCD